MESKSLKRETVALWAAFGVLAIGVAGLATLGWSRIQTQSTALGEVASLEEVEMIEAEMRSFDERLSTLAGRTVSEDAVDMLASRIDVLEGSLEREIDSFRAEIAALEAAVARSNEELPERIELAFEDHASSIRSRVGDLEAAIREREAALGDLVARVENLRRDLRVDLADLETRTDMVDRGLETRVSGAERRLDIVAYAVDRDRVDFEMFTDYSQELSPGIRLHVSKIDRGLQKVSGWIHLVPEGRVVRIDEQPIQEAFVFYTHQDERSHDLVFTRVTKTAAVGYMRIPPESFVNSAGAGWAEPSVALAAQ